MNNEEIRKKTKIESALAGMIDNDFLETSKELLTVLGYRSERTVELPGTAEDFIQRFPARNKNTETEQEFLDSVESVKLMFQVTSEEIAPGDQPTLFESPAFDKGYVRSFTFFAIELKDKDYPRGKYAQFTREVNKRFIMPIVVLFRVKDRLTIGFVGRRQHRLNPDRDVLEQVTLIKDIHLDNPHRAHLDILFGLSLGECAKWMEANKQPEDFDGLLAAWLARLDTSELNKRFFNELADWYFWAVDQVMFPADAGEDVEVRNATGVIRLLTRLIFVWFIREKGLVPDALFNPTELDNILNNLDPQESTYYKAILQNLFFATLNQEMNTEQHPNNRRFRGEGRQHYNITSLYRYKDCFIDPDDALRKFETIPFLNGGLFECLDSPSKADSAVILRVDGFSDRDDNPLHVPNALFFSEERSVDLNAAYGTRGKRHKVRGLIHILSSYKFTIAENTPIEEEVALDPELLGKVFENLLAAYNPETKVTARKQTGSYYTPREIVNYMTDESLIAYLKNELITYSESQTVSLSDAQKVEIEEKLRGLLAYNDAPNPFDETETELLIRSIDTLKILDPACGSGAFPMGVLHKLVFILGKLDPRNEQWRQRQIARVESTIERAEEIDDSTFRENTIRDLEGEIENINEAFERNELDYGRKLYLIENCIYGVDIQPIATQIAKLRFFISLIVDQQIDGSRENHGVRPLPNLETKFVAANTLIGVDKPLQTQIRSPQVDRKEKELAEVRRRHFTARTPRTKAKYRDLDAHIRTEISELLKDLGFPNETTEKIAHWDPYDQNASADFFDPEWMFNVRDGFDMVIGNPPYVRADSGSEYLAIRRKLEESKTYKTLYEKWDLMVPFIEKGLNIANTKGDLIFIVSNAICTSKYAFKLLDWIQKEHFTHSINYFEDITIFEAGVIPVVLHVGKEKGYGTTQKVIRRDSFENIISKTEISAKEFKTLGRDAFRKEFNPIVFRIKTINVGDICYLSYGLRPNSDERYWKGEFTAKDIISKEKDETHSQPYVEGKDLENYLISRTRYLEWDTDRVPRKLVRPTFPELYEPPKIMRGCLTGGIYDDSGLICNHSIVVFVRFSDLRGVNNKSIQSSVKKFNHLPRVELEGISENFAPKYILAVLNSSLASLYLNNIRRHRLENYFYPDDLRKLPIADISLKEQEPFINLVEEICSITKEGDYLENAVKQAKVREYKKRIDKLTYKLYDLTPEEIAIVEGAENV